MKKLYLVVTRDEYEHPIAVADTQRELAKLLGVKENTVNKAYYDIRNGLVHRSQYKEVLIDDTD